MEPPGPAVANRGRDPIQGSPSVSLLRNAMSDSVSLVGPRFQNLHITLLVLLNPDPTLLQPGALYVTLAQHCLLKLQ